MPDIKYLSVYKQFKTIYLVLQLVRNWLKHTDSKQVLVFSVAIVVISTFCIVKNEVLVFTEGDLMAHTSKAMGSTIKRFTKKEQEQID